MDDVANEVVHSWLLRIGDKARKIEFLQREVDDRLIFLLEEGVLGEALHVNE